MTIKLWMWSCYILFPGLPLGSPQCEYPMVYFDCSTAQPGATGTECQKSCSTADMACVSTAQLCQFGCVLKCAVHAQVLLDLLSPFIFHSGWIQIHTGCTSGCICPDGLLSDGAGGCVNETSCPCVHNGQVYQPGETLTVDCNTWFVHFFTSIQRCIFKYSTAVYRYISTTIKNVS